MAGEDIDPRLKEMDPLESSGKKTAAGPGETQKKEAGEAQKRGPEETQRRAPGETQRRGPGDTQRREAAESPKRAGGPPDETRGRTSGPGAKGEDAPGKTEADKAGAGQAEAKKKKRRKLIIIGGAAAGFILAATAAWLFLLSGPGLDSPDENSPDALYAARVGELYRWVEGSDAVLPPPRPAFLTEMRLAGGRAEDLSQGVEDFIQGNYPQALVKFTEASKNLPPDPGMASLQASVHLRLLNYGRAKELYQQALSMRSDKGAAPTLADAADRLGLALCLFHEPDAEGSLREASVAWNIRKEKLGPAAPGTLSALNVMATSLIALSRTAVAGDMLLEAVAAALDRGLKPDDPSLLDSLSILALSFEAQGRLDELSALFGPQEATEAAADPDAPPASPAGGPPQNATIGSAAPAAPAAAPEAPPAQNEQAAFKPVELSEARALYADLSQAHPESGVLPALALGMVNQITGGAAPPCSGPFSVDNYAELLVLCQVLAQGYGRLGMEGEMERILEGFSALVPPPKAAPGTAASRYRVEELLAALKTKNGDDAAAEAALRRAVALSQDEEAEPDPGARADKILLGHLRLADNLLAQGRPPVEAEVELMAAIAQAEKILGRNRMEERPMAALAYLRLGQLLKTMSRSRDSRDFLTRTERAIKAGSSAHPESAEWYKGLGTLAGQIASASARNAGRYDLSLLYRVSLPADKPHRDPSSPEVMRLELTALKLLGRVNDFRPM
ncbi:MAG: hypothetical protein LBE49_01360, partial [Deltaproteobacteria bacterium]|nr:hypothetical protein [Deltaproteobacteria bacterium]